VSDVAIVIDISSTLSFGEFDTQISAIEEIVSLTPVGTDGTHFSYTTFADTYNTVFDFGEYNSSDAMISTINTNTRRRNTFVDVINVIEHVKAEGFLTNSKLRGSARKILIFVSSSDFDYVQLVQSEMDTLKNNNVTIITIGVGLTANITTLRNIATDPALMYILGEELYIAPSVVRSLLSNIVYEFCSHI